MYFTEYYNLDDPATTTNPDSSTDSSSPDSSGYNYEESSAAVDLLFPRASPDYIEFLEFCRWPRQFCGNSAEESQDRCFNEW